MLSGKLGRHTVAVAGILHQASRADTHSLLYIAVKGPPQRAQFGAFVFEHFGNRAILLLGMGPVSQFLTAQAQPGVQRIEIIKGRLRTNNRPRKNWTWFST